MASVDRSWDAVGRRPRIMWSMKTRSNRIMFIVLRVAPLVDRDPRETGPTVLAAFP